MTEAEWLSCDHPAAMLIHLRGEVAAKGSRSQVEGDRCIGTLAFKQPFIHLKGTNYCTHLLLCRGQDFGRDDSVNYQAKPP
jgi:hypothetical protein